MTWLATKARTVSADKPLPGTRLLRFAEGDRGDGRGAGGQGSAVGRNHGSKSGPTLATPVAGGLQGCGAGEGHRQVRCLVCRRLRGEATAIKL